MGLLALPRCVWQEEELARLQHRLGQAYFFPFFQPENAKFELDAGLLFFGQTLNR